MLFAVFCRINNLLFDLMLTSLTAEYIYLPLEVNVGIHLRAIKMGWNIFGRSSSSKSQSELDEDKAFIEALKSRGDAVRVVGRGTVVADPNEIIQSDEYKALAKVASKVVPAS